MSAKEQKKKAHYDTTAFISRLKDIIGNESIHGFAKSCNIPNSTIRMYLNGSTPSIDKITQICAIKNIDIKWLITGEETDAEEINNKNLSQLAEEILLQKCIIELEKFSDEKQITITPEKKAKIICIAYNNALKDTKNGLIPNTTDTITSLISLIS